MRDFVLVTATLVSISLASADAKGPDANTQVHVLGQLSNGRFLVDTISQSYSCEGTEAVARIVLDDCKPFVLQTTLDFIASQREAEEIETEMRAAMFRDETDALESYREMSASELEDEVLRLAVSQLCTGGLSRQGLRGLTYQAVARQITDQFATLAGMDRDVREGVFSSVSRSFGDLESQGRVKFLKSGTRISVTDCMVPSEGEN